jgi:signal peptidase I
MQPTILEGECIFADMHYFQDHLIKSGDLVIFSYDSLPNERYIHRCIAIGGQTVEMKDGAPIVDNKPIWNYGASSRLNSSIDPRKKVDPCIFPIGAGNADNYGPVIVPQGKYFMLGDNTANSRDSRYLGFVDKRMIKGKPIFVYWSSNFYRIGKTFK